MNKEQFKIIFNQYFDGIRNYIFYRCKDEDLATDIAQDTFLKLWEKRDLITEQNIKSLLYKISGDLFISTYRKQKLAQEYKSTLPLENSNESTDNQVQYNELKQQYEKILALMPENYRVVFLMNRIEDLKYHEIAKNLKLSVKAVEKRMSGALKYLKTELRIS